MKKKDLFQYLLEKYKSGTCSASELQQMVQFMKEDQSMYDQLDETVNHDWWKQSMQSDPSKKDLKRQKRKVSGIKPRAWVIAASFLMLVAAGIIWLTMLNGEILYYTDFGERKQIELPDGSQVELNANSRLKWTKNWKLSGVRTVVLDGEAYFNVVKNNNRQFIVNTGDIVVKVLGTSFNVSNRRGETEVFLNEGKVLLGLPDKEEVTMIPGEKIAYDSNVKKVVKTKKETLHSAAAWKIGVIAFHKVPLKSIIKELNDIYGIQLICNDQELNDKMMDVGVPYTNWNATKEALELAMKVEIKETDGNYLVQPKK